MIEVKNRVQLFLDDFLVEQQVGLRRVLHQPEKDPGNPLIVADRPYESPFGPQLYGTVLRDELTGEFRMWYQAQRGKYVTLATSTDGVVWEKPELGLEEFAGSKANNIMLQASSYPNVHKQINNVSILIDLVECDPARRYKMFYYDKYRSDGKRPYPKGGLFLATSADGVHWATHGNRGVMHQLGDVPDVVWDPVTERIVSHNKLIHWEGEEVDSSGKRTGRHVSFYVVPGGWNKNPEVPLEFFGEILLEGEHQWRCMNICLERATAVKKRSIGRAESEDGISWTPQEPILRAGDDDPPDLQFHGMPAWRAGDYWIGMLQNMRTVPGDGREVPAKLPTAMELAYSRDDRHWHRFNPDEMIVPLGQGDAWDAGRIDGATHPVTVGDWEYYYYAACPIWCLDSWWRGQNELTYNIGLARWRREGYVSLRADETGELLTKPFTFAPGELYLNLDGPNSRVSVEILDATEPGRRAMGRAQSVCAHGTRLRLSWEETDVRELAGRPVQMRVQFSNADLYSFVFE